MSSQPPASDMTLIQPPSGASASVVGKLIGKAPPVKDREYTCQPMAQIGRDPRAARFYVNHPSMSRVHARFNKEGGNWIVEDLQSSNGVFVNGNRVQKAFLKDGDEVKFGDVPFDFKMVEAQAPAQPQASSAGLSEMTVFGGEVPQFFAQEIKKEAEAPTQEMGAVQEEKATPKTLQEDREKKYFWMKVRVVAFLGFLFLVLFGGIGAFVLVTSKGKAAKLAIKKLKDDLGDFQANYEEKVYSDAEVPAEFGKQLDMLDALKKQGDDILKEHDGLSGDLVAKIDKHQELISFLVFERKFRLALLNKDGKAADSLIESLNKDGSEEQKKVLPLVKLVKRFELFRRLNPESPLRSKGIPDKGEVESLAKAKGELNKLYMEFSKYLVEVRHLMNLTRAAIDENAYFVTQWKKFWEEYEAFKAAQGDEKKKLLEDLKKAYPNIEVLKKAGGE